MNMGIKQSMGDVIRIIGINANPGYDPVKDFTGISLTCNIPMVMVVHPAVRCLVRTGRIRVN